MASKLNIQVVNALPAGPYDPTTLYIVKGTNANMFEIYMSNLDGSAVRHTPTKDEITADIAAAVNAANSLSVVADITARDALTPANTIQVLVLDASDDPTVDAGAASYIYDAGTTTWHKISEYESLDVVLQWANIQGKPTSSVADIDDAVAKKHSHANAATLDLLGAADGLLQYNGEYVGAVASTVEW